MLTFIVILVVSGALLLGAAWGIYGRLSKPVEGFIVALAGGPHIISVVLELVKPATEETSMWAAFAFVLIGAAVFIMLDYLVDEKWGSGKGGQWEGREARVSDYGRQLRSFCPQQRWRW